MVAVVSFLFLLSSWGVRILNKPYYYTLRAETRKGGEEEKLAVEVGSEVRSEGEL